MSWKKNIPNVLTILNLISGLIAVTLALQGNPGKAGMFVFLAALFDFLDGTAARWLDARTELGRQLDSLADMVSFGVAPAMIMFTLLSAGCEGSCNILEQLHVTPYFALLIPVYSAIRLAKFNIDLRQTENFIGLPTPANALFFASIPLILLYQEQTMTIMNMDFLTTFLSNTRVLAILTVLFSYLLISEFRMFSMKFKHMRWKGNEPRYLLIIIFLLCLAFCSLSAVPLIVTAYFLLSLIWQKQLAE